MSFDLLCISTFEQGQLEPWRYRNAFIIIVIIIIIVVIVTPVSDGQLGYEMGRSEHFDLILLDIMLPSKNGIDICRDLRKDGLTTPILMLAGPKEKIEKEFGSEVGATDYFSKPFHVRGLLAKIKTLLG